MESTTTAMDSRMKVSNSPLSITIKMAGDPNQPYFGCAQPQFYTTNDLDCDDGSVLSFPNAKEL